MERIDHFFQHQLKVIIFWRSAEHASQSSRKARTVNTFAALSSRLNALKTDDMTTGHTVVITSYQTWATRTTVRKKSEESGQVRLL